jgi:glycosyltransferase involved in cell wall biosynthesis
VKVDAIIPALDEADSVGLVLELLPSPPVRRVIVADNGSTDATAEVARGHGATVVFEPRRGYGAACLKGIEALASDPPDAVLFLDADLSDDPAEASAVLAPILEGSADLVVGSRVLGNPDPGALAPHARFGNWLATRLLAALYGVRYTDLGPFRAIRYDALRSLGMRDRDFGWTIEMQLKAARHGLRHAEVPVRYRRRVGRSKISGTFVGSARAGAKILSTLFAHLLDPSSRAGVP